MSVRDLGDGRQRVEVYGRRQPDGTRPKMVRVIHGTKRDGERVERELLTQRDAGIITSNVTVEQYAARFLAHKQREPGRDGKPIAPRTYAHYERCVDLYLVRRIGAMKMREVTTTTIRDLFADLRFAGKSGREISGTTRQGIEMVIKMVFARAYHDRLIDFDPARGVRKTPTDTPEPDCLSADEAAAFLEAIAGRVVHVPAALMLTTGMRPEEMLGVQRRNLDLDSGVVKVRTAVSLDDGQPVLRDLKTKRSRRTLSLAEDVCALLAAHLEHVDATAARWPQYWEEHGMVFPSLRVSRGGHPMGRLWSPTAFGHAWRRAVPDDWRHVRPYTMRHTYITGLLAAGVHLETASRLAGHASSVITATTYSHVYEDEVASVVVGLPRRARG